MVAFGAGVAAGLAVAVPLGAIGVLVIRLGALRGTRAGLSAGAGVATADVLYAAVAAAGGAAVAAALRPYEMTLRLTAGLVLLLVAAVGLARATRLGSGAEVPATPPPRRAGLVRTYLGFLALTVVNPLTAATFAALVVGLPQRIIASGADRAAFVAGVGLASLAWQAALGTVGAALGARPGRRWHRATSIGGSLVVAALALRILTS